MLRWLLPLPLALGAIVAAGALAVERSAPAIAAQLSLVATALTRAAPSPAPEEPFVEVLAVAPEAASEPAPKTGRSRRAPSAKPPASVFVPAARVLALAESGARPRGKLVPATARRPAGLRLSGVTALGLGVLDGDVLTQAAGVSALDASAVIEAVLRARGRRQQTITGTCFRGDEPYAITVEQPYLQPLRAAAEPNAPRP